MSQFDLYYQIPALQAAFDEKIAQLNAAALGSQIDVAKLAFLLDSDKFAGKVNFENYVIDLLKDSTGINVGVSSNYVFNNVSKSVGVGVGVNNLVGGNASASSNDGNLPDNAFDGNLSTFWRSLSGQVIGTLEYNIGVNKYVHKYGIYFYAVGTAQPKSWTFEGWNGATWEILHTVVNQVLPGVDGWIYYTPTTSNYSKYRLNISVNQGSVTNVAVYEFRAYTSGPATVIWTADVDTISPVQCFVIADESLGTGTIIYSMSKDNGVTWVVVPKEILTDFVLGAGMTMVLKAVITGDAELKAVAWGWR